MNSQTSTLMTIRVIVTYCFLMCFQVVGVVQRNEHSAFPPPPQCGHLFWPGTHNTSSAPLSLTARAATNRKSEARFKYLIVSGLTCSSGLAGQLDREPLGAAHHGAGQMQKGRRL
jgi:hypothetical protein